MIMPITLIIIILVWAYLRLRGGDSRQLIEPRPAPPTRGIQIICGNCSGEEGTPRKTYMDRFGNCAQCGGRSFMLASDRGLYLRRLLAERMPENGGRLNEARVLPFGRPSGGRTMHTEKIAI
jgi:hypothetical protein